MSQSFKGTHRPTGTGKVPGRVPPVQTAPLLSEATAVELDAMPARLKPKEVAAYLAISVEQVMQFRDGSELEFINVATPGATRPSWRITRSSLLAFESKRLTQKRK